MDWDILLHVCFLESKALKLQKLQLDRVEIYLIEFLIIKKSGKKPANKNKMLVVMFF